jgi:DNA-binding NarL/FixJ family response regulator
VNIIVADRLWMTRSSIAALLAEAAPTATVECVADTETLRRALVGRADTAIVLIDDALVGDREEAMFAQIRALAPSAIIGLLVAHPDRERVLKAIYFGALAIILKQDDRDEILAALRLMLAGHVAFPRRILATGPTSAPLQAPEPLGPPGEEGALTQREREVIGLIGEGRSVARIATDLKLSPHTVRVHVTRIMKKLDLRDRPALMYYAVTRTRVRHSPTTAPHPPSAP